jgi:hypothetical protein
MLKTLDILIGATTVLLLFSMAVTVITQAITSVLNKKGKHLLAGLSSLLQQLGVTNVIDAQSIARAVLTHPMVAEVQGKLGTVVQRGEFTKLLLDLASGQGAAKLEDGALVALKAMLKQNGVADPAQTLKNINAMAMSLQMSNPDLAGHVRDELAILQEGSSDYVAKIHFWFDQTIDRVSQAFTKHAQRVTFVAAIVVVLAMQFDIIAVVNRLSIDDQFRNAVVSDAANSLDKATKDASTSTNNYNVDTHTYYNLLNSAGLVTMPTNHQWFDQLKDPRKIPGMLIAIFLISLGAPFWYNILKDLIGLRSSLSQKDDAQRTQRQMAQPSSSVGSTTPSNAVSGAPSWVKGESGDLTATG